MSTATSSWRTVPAHQLGSTTMTHIMMNHKYCSLASHHQWITYKLTIWGKSEQETITHSTHNIMIVQYIMCYSYCNRQSLPVYTLYNQHSLSFTFLCSCAVANSLVLYDIVWAHSKMPFVYKLVVSLEAHEAYSVH